MTEETKTPPLTFVQWLIVAVAALGFAFDIYELLMLPLIARPALESLLQVDQYTPAGNARILDWFGYIMYASALSGGIFGLLGGYLTDWFGRRRVLVWSILLYAFSAMASGFSTSPLMLLGFRCLTFIGVCVEFVAAVAWLAELFPEPKRREAVLGYTQAFSSIGGLMVTGAYMLIVHFRADLPAIFGEHETWRYMLISGVIPALPLIVIRPFLPESPAWAEKKASGTLRRPSFRELFHAPLARTTIVAAALVACAYGVAFGAIQLAPQIAPGLVAKYRVIPTLRKEYDEKRDDATAAAETKAKLEQLQDEAQKDIGRVQLSQELGGLAGRFFLAWLAVRIARKRLLLAMFLIPAAIVVPFTFAVPGAGRFGADSYYWFQGFMFLAGFFTVGQFSYWGNYLPAAYPVHLRGTGESFAANVGGRMIGTAANPVVTLVVVPLLAGVWTGMPRPAVLATGAAIVAGTILILGLVLLSFLPEPKSQGVD